MGVEDDCVCSSPKLFVGQVPIDVDENALRRRFESLGHVQRIDMLTPRQLNVSTRSAMIWFETWSDVERILEGAEEGRLDLGSTKRLVIRIADPPKRADRCVGIKPRKLFVGQVRLETSLVAGDTSSRMCDNRFRVRFRRVTWRDSFRSLVRSLSSRCPSVLQVASRVCVSSICVVRDVVAVCCAFVRFEKWRQAEDAIRTLNERFQFQESKRPLVVKFADAKTADPVRSAAQVIGEKRPLTPEDRADVTKRPFSLPCGGEQRKRDPLEMGYLSSRMGMPMGMGNLIGMGRLEWVQEESHRFLKVTDTDEWASS